MDLNQNIIMHLPKESIAIVNIDSIFHRLENQI